MNDFNIRVTHRIELGGGNVSERVIDIETIPDRVTPTTTVVAAQLDSIDPESPALRRAMGLAPAPRFTKVLANGMHCVAGDARTDHVAVLFPDGWMVAVAPLASNGKAFKNHQAAEEGARKLDLLGYDDWQLAPLEVWERHVLDRTRHNPAVHADLFPNLRTDDWYWTADTCAWSVDESTGVAASAWYVNAYGGGVGYFRRDSSGFALAARRAGQ